MSCGLRLFLIFTSMLGLLTRGAAQSLRQEADRAGILVGAAVNVAYLSEPAYTRTLAREFNMLEPEDALKWAGDPAADEKTFDFADGDRLVAFAADHKMKVRGHNLVWGRYKTQKWLTRMESFTSEQLKNLLLREHIKQVVAHYRGTVFAWDVVNEAFDENGHGCAIPSGTKPPRHWPGGERHDIHRAGIPLGA